MTHNLNKQKPLKTKKIINKKLVDNILTGPLNDQISNLLQTQCAHKDYWGYHDGTKTYVCQNVCTCIAKAVDSGIMLDTKTINEFLSSLVHVGNNNTSYYYGGNRNRTCLNLNGGILSNTIYSIFITYDINDKVLSETITKLLKCILDPNLGISSEYDLCFKVLHNYDLSCIIDNIHERLIDFCDAWNDLDFCESIIHNVKMTDDVFNKLCCTRSTNMNRLIAKYDRNVTQTHLYLACKCMPYSKELLVALCNRGLVLDAKCLDIVCADCDINEISYIISAGKVPVEKRHFQSLVTSTLYTPRKDRKKYSYYDKNTEKKSGYTEEKMELLINSGFKPDYDDVCFAIKHSKQIPGLERFTDIKCDQKMLDLCWDYDFYPNYKFDCISENMIQLQKMCLNGCRKGDIQPFIKKNNIVPDRKCMENASAYKNNTACLEVLVAAGGRFNFNCLKRCIAEYKSNKTITYILQQYENTLNDERDSYKQKIEFLEAKLKEATGSVPAMPEAVAKELKTKKKKKVIKPKKRVAGNQALNDLATALDNAQLLVDIPDKNVSAAVPKKYAEYFGLDDDASLSFVELKEHFMKYIKENKWIRSYGEGQIVFPDDFCALLNIRNKEVANIDDVDKLMLLFYL
jgi:hypothetical protein